MLIQSQAGLNSDRAKYIILTMNGNYYNKHPVTPELEILFEDNHLLALLKPAGMLVQGDATGDETLLERAKSYLKAKYGKPGKVFLGLVHRLDRPTSGVVVFARTSKAANRLSAQFRAKTAKKTYLALVEGLVTPQHGRLVHHLKRLDKRRRTEPASPDDPSARKSELTWRVISRKNGRSLLEITPITGRTHQIRVQLAAFGHPIAGDRKYGAKMKWPGKNIALAAIRLIIEHPTKNEPITLEAPAPKWAKA